MIVRRYFLPEVFGTLAALAGAWVTKEATGSAWAAAWGGMAGETLGFYGTVLWRDTRGVPWRGGPGLAGRGRLRAMVALVPGSLVEFGPAEIADTFVRPVLMYAGPILCADLTVGTLLGKIAADLLFYAVVLPCRAVRLRRGRGAKTLTDIKP